MKAAQEISQPASLRSGLDVEAIRKAMDELSTAIQKVGAAMYQQGDQAAAGATPGADQTAGSSDAGPATEGPVDAEFKEVPKE